MVSNKSAAVRRHLVRPAGLRIPSIECQSPLSLPGGLVGVDISLVKQVWFSLWKFGTSTL